MKKGKFYGIGVGVGDPENITVKATKKLHEVDVIVLPEAKSGEGSTAFNIVKEYVKAGVEQMFLEFPMIKDVEARKVFRKNNADKVSAELEKGKNVAFLTIGDPMTYSTYTYVLEHIADDVEVETIAGITSFNSIAARLNVPLMIGDEDLKVVSVNRKTDIYKEIENNDNLVLMKISRNFEKIKKAIIETGNKENAVIVSDCGKDNEVVYWDIESVEEVPYFSTMILKKKGVKEWKRFLEIL
jgi:precorrin-2 C(20)-methyltransferase